MKIPIDFHLKLDYNIFIEHEAFYLKGLNMQPNVRTVDCGSFVTPILRIVYRKKQMNHDLKLPWADKECDIFKEYQVYGYKYKTGTGWKLIGETTSLSEAEQMAREYDAEMYEYWNLTEDRY